MDLVSELSWRWSYQWKKVQPDFCNLILLTDI